MDNQRLLVWAAFGLMLWFTYQAWRQDYAPQPPAIDRVPEVGQPAEGPPGATEDLPAIPEGATQALPDTGPELPAETTAAADSAAESIRVRTDVLDVEISRRGGTLTKAVLLDYPVAKDRPDVLVQLLSPGGPDIGLIQTGLRSAGDGPEPNHLALFQSEQSDYVLGNADSLAVRLSWEDGQGTRVTKTYRFRRGSYIVDVEQTLANSAPGDWRGAEYAQIQRRLYAQDRSLFNVDSYSFDGPILYDGERASKLNRDDLQKDGPVLASTDQGWVATIQHHFLSAIVPARDTSQRYSVSIRDDVATASAIGAPVVVPPGEARNFTTTLFVGPKLQSQLEQVSSTLKLTVDYGWLTIISEPLFWVLAKVYDFVGNWGLAIIIVTILIKLVFYKLTEASGRSMAKMREIQPRMKALQERYKDDRQQLSQAMMDLYKREKVNPAAGCLPILIQMPFFLAFYWVLLESVEMRQAPFALWITDLSSRDPYFILPLIMGAAMFIQQKLNPAPADPMQARVMQIMPVVFTAFFAFFPSGLVLYWVTNTVLSIAQQWHINRVVEAERKKQRHGRKDRQKGKDKNKNGRDKAQGVDDAPPDNPGDEGRNGKS